MELGFWKAKDERGRQKGAGSEPHAGTLITSRWNNVTGA